MKFAIVLEADSEKGFGHLFRCIEIASKLKSKGHNCFFISPYTSNVIKKFVGSDYVICPDFNSDDYKIFWESFIKVNSIDIIILDLVEKSYSLHAFLTKHHNVLITSITMFNFNCDRFEDIAFFPDMDKLPYKHIQSVSGKEIEVHSGKEYIVFREEFNIIFQKNKLIREIGTRVLITMGGSDPENFTLKAIEALEDCKLDIKTVVALSSQMKWRNLILDRKKTLKKEYIFIEDSKDISNYMFDSDIAIINGGNTRYELALVGTPFIAISLHEVQFKITQKLMRYNVGINAGIGNYLDTSNITKSIESILLDQRYRESVYNNRNNLFDTHAAERICNHLIEAASKRKFSK